MPIIRTPITRRATLLGLASTAVTGLSTPAISQQKSSRAVRFMNLPIAGLAGLHIAQKQGFFEEEGVEVELVSGRTPASGVAMMLGGQLDVSVLNPGGMGSAAIQNLPLKVLASCYYLGDDTGVYVRKDSPILSVKDLPGKSIAMLQLGNNAQGCIMDTLEREGVDPHSVDFSLIPAANMLSSLMAGNIEAATLFEPFIAQGGDEVRPIIKNIFGFSGGRAIAAYWLTSAQFKTENPELANGLKRALDRGSEFAASNPDVLRETIADMVNLDSNSAARIMLPQYSPDLSLDNAQGQIDIMTRFGFFTEKPDVSPYFI